MDGLGCNCGMGEADTAILEPPTETRFPTVEKVLAKYIADCLRDGVAFYIDPTLNSDVLRGVVDPDDIDTMFGMGFLPGLGAIFSAVIGAAATVGKAVIAVAPAVAEIGGTYAAVKTAQAANKQLASKGTVIPNGIAAQTVQAAQNDFGGLSSNTLLLLAGGFAALMIFTSRRR